MVVSLTPVRILTALVCTDCRIVGLAKGGLYIEGRKVEALSCHPRNDTIVELFESSLVNFIVESTHAHKGTVFPCAHGVDRKVA